MANKLDPPIDLIPDLDVGRVYTLRGPLNEFHYETFERLAEFFGRNTPVHQHKGFFQIHVLLHGGIRLNLDGRLYQGDAPLLFFTPPAIPHTFYTEPDTVGHVLTVRQEIVREWNHAQPGHWSEAQLRRPAFVEFGSDHVGVGSDFAHLLATIGLISDEFMGERRGRAGAMRAMGKVFFIHLARVLESPDGGESVRPQRREDLRVFLGFCDLVEEHFREHLTVVEYARRLAVTAPRLNDICRRMADRSSKDVVHERLEQEARRLLRYSQVPVGEISYLLGFGDAAYFSRFFSNRTGNAPSAYRESVTGS
jgi:AraC family 4-hydroxyphenylacetate 3-monooxygenase operon regulatory protein